VRVYALPSAAAYIFYMRESENGGSIAIDAVVIRSVLCIGSKANKRQQGQQPNTVMAILRGDSRIF
jgi:hypothetical protein